MIVGHNHSENYSGQTKKSKTDGFYLHQTKVSILKK
jgi:hypothetical protein